MKDILKKYKVGFILTIVVLVILSGITIVRFIKAENAVKLAINEKALNFAEADINDAGWIIPEVEQKKKELHWMENQLLDFLIG